MTLASKKLLNLGCGYRKMIGYINIDNRKEVNPDILCDVAKGLPYEDDSVDVIIAQDFLEHIPIGKTVSVVEEVYRVLKPDGKFWSMTPSTKGRGAFQDPTHVSFWNPNSFLYFMDDAHRNLYGIKAKFKGGIEENLTNIQLNVWHVFADLRAVK